jgi:hypothetical protein
VEKFSRNNGEILMIRDAKEFVQLRTGINPQDYLRAANDSASLEVWRTIVKDYPEMRVWVARNKTVPIEVLQRLAADADPAVRAVVATKNKLPADLMRLLADDTEETVRERLVYNKNALREILERLATDPIHRISLAASERLRGMAES